MERQTMRETGTISGRELLRVILHDDGTDEGEIKIILVPWCENVATRHKADAVVQEIGRHVRRAIGSGWVRELRQLGRSEHVFLLASMHDDGMIEVAVGSDDEESGPDKLADRVMATISRTFGEDVLRELKAMNAPSRTVH
jgi:hypothetical protein